MFDIASSVAVLRDAETILTSNLLNDDERVTLLEALHTTTPYAQDRMPHIGIARAVVGRTLGELHGKDRTAKRVEEQAEVAEGSSRAEQAEASEGEAEGIEEQAEDDSRFSGRRGKRKTRKAKAPAG